MITCITFSFSLKIINISLLLLRTNFQILCTSLMFYKKNISFYWAPLVHMLTGVSRRAYQTLGLAFVEREYLKVSIISEGLKTTVDSEWRLQAAPPS